MHICWGLDRTIFCNDAQLILLKGRAAYAPGCSGREIFPEFWDKIGPAIDAVFEAGEDGRTCDAEERHDERGNRPPVDDEAPRR